MLSTNEEDVYVETLQRIGHSIKGLFTSIQGGIIVASSTVIALSDTWKGILVLLSFSALDLVTGCIASWMEHKKDPQPIKVYFIESAKIRKSIIKIVTYGALLYFAWALTELFFNLAFNIPGSSKDFLLLDLAIGACIAVECYSNIENLKRAGFDLFGTISNIAKTGWKLFRQIKTGKDA